MIDIAFYQLTFSSLEKTLPKLVEKVYESNQRSVVILDSQERIEALNSSLWTYSPSSFLPHGCSQDKPENQPIWLTSHFENPNQSEVVIITTGETLPFANNFKKALDIFEGQDKETLENAQMRYKYYQNNQYNCIYWRQNLKGQWEKA